MTAPVALAPAARAAILDALADLAWALDTGDAERFAGVFAADADFVLEAGDQRLRVEGRDALVADFLERRRTPVVGTQHRLDTPLFVPDGDGWTVWTYWSTSIREPRTGEVHLAGSGWACDRLRAEAGGWRIVHHHVAGWRERMPHPRVARSCCEDPA